MNSLESFLLNSGFSWTYSKAIPYILVVVIGVLLIYLIKNRITKLRKPLRWLIKFVLFVVPFGVYFLFFPIYEGDFSNSSDQISIDGYEELSGKKFVVLTIPNCPFCYEAIGKMKKIKERVASIDIDYIVCSSDSSSINFYKEEGQGVISVNLAEDAQKMSELAKGSFPTFVLVDDKEELQRWSNDNFGVRAVDFIEENFQ